MKPAAVLYAKDLSALHAFYEAALGLAARHAAPDHVILESSNFQLTLVRIPAAVASEIHVETPPRRRESVPVKLVFGVADIATARGQWPALGGAVDGPEREWEFEGTRVCDAVDPEGNVLQLRS
jgi:predicted enzyme related to lactoylglutathione lyase